MAMHHPRAIRVVVGHEKVCKGPLRLRKKKVRASDARKAVERDPAYS
jgi:hypothetical protein